LQSPSNVVNEKRVNNLVDGLLLATVAGRGVATGWTGVDMSTPLLPETIPEIDADPASFFGGGGWG